MKRDSFQARALRAIAHPLRSDIIMTLSQGPKRFSRVMEFCGLDPGHDTGPFFHHLSSLMESGIVQRQEENYSLTNFGSRIAELLAAVRREAEYQSRKSQDNGGIGMELVRKSGVDLHWAQPEDMESGRYGIKIWELDKEPKPEAQKAWSLSPEQLDRYDKWVDSIPSIEGQRMLVAERQGRPSGSLEFRPMIEIRGIMEGEEASKETRKVMADVGGIAILDHGKQRAEVAKALLTRLIDEGHVNHLQKIKISKISSEDEKVIQVLQELGFERTDTYYEMAREP